MVETTPGQVRRQSGILLEGHFCLCWRGSSKAPRASLRRVVAAALRNDDKTKSPSTVAYPTIQREQSQSWNHKAYSQSRCQMHRIQRADRLDGEPLTGPVQHDRVDLHKRPSGHGFAKPNAQVSCLHIAHGALNDPASQSSVTFGHRQPRRDYHGGGPQVQVYLLTPWLIQQPRQDGA